MIEIINDTVTIPNWDKHQSLDAYEKKKERDRIYQAERRAAQKQIAEKSSDTSSDVASKIRREKKRLEKTREDVDVEGEADETASTTASDENVLRKCGGTLGKNVLYLTDKQDEDLLEMLGLDAYDRYLDRLSTFIIETGAHVKNHYETILKWYEEDTKMTGN
jgi:hypothetical protein